MDGGLSDMYNTSHLLADNEVSMKTFICFFRLVEQDFCYSWASMFAAGDEYVSLMLFFCFLHVLTVSELLLSSFMPR